MKTKILLISLVLAGAAVFAAAQAKGPFGGHRHHLGRAIEHLDLSDEQAAQIEALRDKHRAEMQALREAGERPSRDAMRERFEAHRAQFEALLTPDQLATLEELKSERGMRGKGHKRGHRGHPLGRALHRLDLSDEQKEQLKALRAERREEMREKRQSGERPTREEMAAHWTQMRADLAEILDTDQLAVLDEIQERRGERGMRGKGNKRGHRLGGTLRQLDLSDDQKEQLKALRQEHRAQRKASRESGERPSLEEIEAHRAEARARLEAILTPEQREKLNGLLPADEGGNAAGAAKSSATSLESQSWGAIKEEAKKD